MWKRGISRRETERKREENGMKRMKEDDKKMEEEKKRDEGKRKERRQREEKREREREKLTRGKSERGWRERRGRGRSELASRAVDSVCVCVCVLCVQRKCYCTVSGRDSCVIRMLSYRYILDVFILFYYFFFLLLFVLACFSGLDTEQACLYCRVLCSTVSIE